MQIKAKILGTKIDENGRKLAKIECNGKLPPVGTMVTIRFGKIRSLSQNSLYFALLAWLLDEGGLKDKGYMTTTDLHESLKGRLLSRIVKDKAGLPTRVVGSTTDLDASEFMDYISNVDTLLCTFFEISTAPFWKEYNNLYGKY